MTYRLFYNRCQPWWLIVSFVLWVGLSKDAFTQDKQLGDGSSQVMEFAPLPARYRQPPTREEMFTLSELGRLTPGGRWYLTWLVRHDKTHKSYGGTTWGFEPFDNGIYTVGLVAIDLKSGEAKSALPVKMVGKKFPVGFYVIDDESCFVVAGGIAYEWNLQTGVVMRRGYGGQEGTIANFAAAVGPGLRSRIVWPHSESDWDGETVKLSASDSFPEIQFNLTDPAGITGHSTRKDDEWRMPRFKPGPRDNEVLVLYDVSVDVWAAVVSLTDEVVPRWTVKRSQLVNPSGATMSFGYRYPFPAGLEGGHKLIPLLMNSGKDDHLAVIQSSDGKLIRCDPLGPCTASTDVACSGDGGRVAWTWVVEDERLSWETYEKWVAIIDLKTQQRISQFAYTHTDSLPPGEPRPEFLRAVGFNSDQQLIMSGTDRVFSLPAPYDGRLQLRFRLRHTPATE